MVLMYHFETEEWAGCGGAGGSQGGKGVEPVGVIQQKIVVMNTRCHPPITHLNIVEAQY